MTAFSTAANAIRSRLSSMWSATPIGYKNAPHDPTDGQAFLFLEVLNGEASQASIGSPGARVFRHPGVIMVHVFVPMGIGEKLALEHADAVAAIFRAQSFDGVLCYAPSVGDGEPADDDGKWYRVTVSVPFHFDAIF